MLKKGFLDIIDVNVSQARYHGRIRNSVAPSRTSGSIDSLQSVTPARSWHNRSQTRCNSSLERRPCLEREPKVTCQTRLLGALALGRCQRSRSWKLPPLASARKHTGSSGWGTKWQGASPSPKHLFGIRIFVTVRPGRMIVGTDAPHPVDTKRGAQTQHDRPASASYDAWPEGAVELGGTANLRVLGRELGRGPGEMIDG